MAKDKKIIIFSPTGIAIGAGLVFIFFVFLYFRGTSYATAKFLLHDEIFTARIADTDDKRTLGLSGTSGLGKNEAMVFKMPGLNRYSFWMKDMQYPLDILWLKGNTIVDMAPRVPPAPIGAPDDQIQKYTSRLDADIVVEVVSGTVDRL